MKKPTQDQVTKALRGDERDKAVSSDELQTVMATGLLHDLWDAARKGTVTFANRMQVRALLGLEAVEKVSAVFYPDSFTYVVNYDVRLEDLIRIGEYAADDVDYNVMSINFPATRTGTVTLEGGRLVCFDGAIHVKEAEKKINEMDLRPADAYELCTFGNAFPEMERNRLILAIGGPHWLGSGRGTGRSYIVHICRSNLGRRSIGLSTVQTDYRNSPDFLVFPKK